MIKISSWRVPESIRAIEPRDPRAIWERSLYRARVCSLPRGERGPRGERTRDGDRPQITISLSINDAAVPIVIYESLPCVLLAPLGSLSRDGKQTRAGHIARLLNCSGVSVATALETILLRATL